MVHWGQYKRFLVKFMYIRHDKIKDHWIPSRVFNYLLQITLGVYNSWIKAVTYRIKITSSDNSRVWAFRFKNVATIKKIFVNLFRSSWLIEGGIYTHAVAIRDIARGSHLGRRTTHKHSKFSSFKSCRTLTGMFSRTYNATSPPLHDDLSSLLTMLKFGIWTNSSGMLWFNHVSITNTISDACKLQFQLREFLDTSILRWIIAH